LHDVSSQRPFGRQAIVRTAQQPQIGWIGRSTRCVRPDVIDLQALPALAACSIRRDECALTSISDENFVSHLVRYVA
jgi:hypothetical protein